MGNYKIEHNRPDCISCGACAAIAPDFWEMAEEDNKSTIKGCSKRHDGWEELPIVEKDFALNKEAADFCPVNVIHIVNEKTN